MLLPKGARGPEPERVNIAPNTWGGPHPQAIWDLEKEAQHEEKQQHWQEQQCKFETQGEQSISFEAQEKEQNKGAVQRDRTGWQCR